MPLNPMLFNALKSLFGDVRVYKEGQAPIVARSRNELVVHDAGEEYAVCCPFCNDRRFRLYINHRYYHPHDPSADLFAWRAHCFNEECLEDPDNREKLKEMVISACKRVPIEPLSRPDDNNTYEPVSLELPDCVPIHEALPLLPELELLLREHRIDPLSMSRWEAYICCDENHPAYGRILVPIRAIEKGEKGEIKATHIVGLQSRVIGGLAHYGKLKYMTRGRPALSLYNFKDAIESSNTIILVEGFLDAWRVGKMACPVLGSHLSQAQLDLLCKYARDRYILVMFDGDAEDKSKRVGSKIARAGLNVVIVNLPHGKDPCELSDDELLKCLDRSISLEVLNGRSV